MRHPPHCWRLCPATLDIGQWTLDFGHRSEGGCAAGGGGQHSRSFGAGDVCNFGFLPQLSAFSIQLSVGHQFTISAPNEFKWRQCRS